MCKCESLEGNTVTVFVTPTTFPFVSPMIQPIKVPTCIVWKIIGPDERLRFDLGSIVIKDPGNNFGTPTLSDDCRSICIEDHCLGTKEHSYCYDLYFAGDRVPIDPSIDNEPH